MGVKLNREKMVAYLANPEACPFCGSEKIKAKGASFIDVICSRDIECTNCKEVFTEEFVMVGISQDDDVLIIHQDNFLDNVEATYYDGYTNNTE